MNWLVGWLMASVGFMLGFLLCGLLSADKRIEKDEDHVENE